MLSTITSGALQGMKAYLVRVEVDVSAGLPCFSMVGYLSGEVREARERVQVALRNTGVEIRPMKITVNLSPANIRKEGTAFDLPIAVGLLESLGYCGKKELSDILFLGELGLDGEIKPVRGVLPIVKEAAESGLKYCIVPRDNLREAAVIPGITVWGVDNVRKLLQILRETEEMEILTSVECYSSMPKDGRELPWMEEKLSMEEKHPIDEKLSIEEKNSFPDFSEVSGQEAAKRAAEIAAAGFHNLLMVGPPGAGKSMIAKRIPGILPNLTIEESLEVSAIYSVAGLLGGSQSLITGRPFQSPHHTITHTALIGGGTVPRPGIISLAHRGVLFLDELPEFGRSVLDSLRQPLEEQQVQIARLGGNISYPANLILVCAMNPCPCGYYPDKNRCICKEAEIKRYLGKISGPILDRVDLCVETLPVNIAKLKVGKTGESSEAIRERVLQARKRQHRRFIGTNYCFNADIAAADINKYCALGQEEQRLLEQVYETFGLSARAYHRILKVARTIADLEGEEQIQTEHLMEAVYYRTADHNYWRNQSGATT